MELEFTVRKYVLQNAIRYNGKANPGAIMGKVLGEDPSLRAKAKEISMLIQTIIKEINTLSVEEQKKLLEEAAPELLEKKEHKEKDIYAFLEIKEGDRVVTAFPPEPSKYPHIGHAKALILNYELAKKYNGKFILRFEDTNPGLAKKEFYDIHTDNYKWLGIKWDEIIYASDYMEKFYEHAEKLIKEGNAYICTCVGDKIKEGRMKGIACDCRDNSCESNLEQWKEMFDADEGSMILRMKIDLKHKNSTMRDPTIMRIVTGTHARTGDKYRIWPNYDFENSIMDGISQITHRLRTKEFELRSELQKFIQRSLGFNETCSYEFARFNMTGVESSGRIIREKVEKGELLGWDDPSLTTLVALRRRGFLPQAIKNFVLSTGMTKNEATLTWDDLIIHNKRLLEEGADRYFFIEDPQKITVSGAEEQVVEMDLHPDHKKGGRVLKTGSEFYVTKNDLEKLPEGKLSRLMDCLNFTKTHDEFSFKSFTHKDFKGSEGIIIHWLPISEDLLKVDVMTPDKGVKKGLAEAGIKDVKPGQVIQFERFGFCRLDCIEDGVYKFWYSHN